MILAIYGTGGQGREIFELAQDVQTDTPRWRDIIFIDDHKDGEKVKGATVYSFNGATKEYSTDAIEVVIAVGEPSIRKKLFEKVSNCGYEFASLIHPQAYVSPGAIIGRGCTIKRGATISDNAVLADNVDIQFNSVVGHDTRIGAHSEVCSLVSIGGLCSLGNEVFLGQSSSIREGCSIGSNAVLGMGAALLIDVPDGATAASNPARVIDKVRSRNVFRANG